MLNLEATSLAHGKGKVLLNLLEVLPWRLLIEGLAVHNQYP